MTPFSQCPYCKSTKVEIQNQDWSSEAESAQIDHLIHCANCSATYSFVEGYIKVDESLELVEPGKNLLTIVE